MTLGKFLKHGSNFAHLQSLKFIYFGSSNHPFQIMGKSGFWILVHLMERIIRLNAVKNLCHHKGILGIHQHNLHPFEHLAPQKTVSGVSFVLLIEALLNTSNKRISKAIVGYTSIKRLKSQPLLVHITFVVIFAMGITGKIEWLASLPNQVWLRVVKSCKKIEPRIRQEQMLIEDKKVFYDRSTVSLTNPSFRQVNIFTLLEKVQVKLALLSQWGCEFMYEEVVSIFDTTALKKISQQCYQVELRLEGNKQLIT